MLLNAVSLSYLSDVKMNTRKKYHAFTCQVLAEIVNRILYQKTGRSGQILYQTPGNHSHYHVISLKRARVI